MHTLEQLRSGALAGAREVRLCRLGLTEFPPELLALADTLEVLDLSGNQLTSLPPQLAQLHQLRILFASNNPFTELPAVLGQLPQLEMVGFKACAIRHVPAASLPARLRWLILTDNQLTALPATLGQRPRLQKLMLSCNRLQALPDLSGCTRLELLRLASNQFTAVPDAVRQLPQLAWLALAGNPMTQKSELLTQEISTSAAIFYENFEVGELLGEGASGHIYRARQRPTGELVALKVFKAAHTSDGTPQSELAAGLAAGAHPQLVTPLAAVTGHPEGRLSMALPLLPPAMHALAGPPSMASCTRDVYAPGLPLTQARAQQVFAQIRDAVQHLHARRVIHGDLYAHNVLWNPATGEARLSDFGAALLTQALPDHWVDTLQRIELRALEILRTELDSMAGIPPP